MTSKKEAQAVSCTIEPITEEEDAEEIKGMFNSVSVLNQVTPETWWKNRRKIPS